MTYTDIARSLSFRSQPILTYLKLTIATLEQGVKFVES